MAFIDPQSGGSIPEYDNITVSANSFTAEEQMYLYGWTTQAFHSLGILEYVAKFYNQVHGFKFIRFYDALLDFCWFALTPCSVGNMEF